MHEYHRYTPTVRNKKVIPTLKNPDAKKAVITSVDSFLSFFLKAV